MKSFLKFIWETLKIVLIALAIVVPIRYFLFQPFFVRGESMWPNFADGDYLIVDELSYRLRDPQRGEVVVFKFPQDPSQRYIKRIIGLPGETVEIKDNQVKILSEGKDPEILGEDYLSSSTQTLGSITVVLGENEFFVLGDNRLVSSDSRRWGVLPREDLIGRVYFRAWPLNNLDKIEIPIY